MALAEEQGGYAAPAPQWTSVSPQVYYDEQVAMGGNPYTPPPPSEYYDNATYGGSMQPTPVQQAGTYEQQAQLDYAAAGLLPTPVQYGVAAPPMYPGGAGNMGYAPQQSQRSQGIGGWVQGVSDAAATGLQNASDGLFRLFDDASRVFMGSTPPPPLPSPGLGMGGPIPGGQVSYGPGDWSGSGGGGGGFEGPDSLGPIGPPGAGGLPGGSQMPFTFPSSGGYPDPDAGQRWAPPASPGGEGKSYDPGMPPLIPGFVPPAILPVPPGGVPIPVPLPVPPGGVPVPPGGGLVDIIPPIGGAPIPGGPIGPGGPVLPQNPSPAPAPPPAAPAPAPAPLPGGPAPAPAYAAPAPAAPAQGTPLITPTGEVYGTLTTNAQGQTVVKKLPKGKPNRWNIPQLPTTDLRAQMIANGQAGTALPPGITQTVPPGFALPPGFLMPRWAEQTPLPPPLYDRLQPGVPNRGQAPQNQQQGGGGRKKDRR